MWSENAVNEDETVQSLVNWSIKHGRSVVNISRRSVGVVADRMMADSVSTPVHLVVAIKPRLVAAAVVDG